MGSGTPGKAACHKMQKRPQFSAIRIKISMFTSVDEEELAASGDWPQFVELKTSGCGNPHSTYSA
jgi:hypothetical protein